jgi:hypothetical protein
MEAPMRPLARAAMLLVAVFAAGGAPAAAQFQPPPSADHEQPRTGQDEHSDPKACTPRSGTTGAPLSDKLAQTDGVICPPAAVDPDIKLAPPPGSGGRMPVIPPPGSPGGDPSLRPK